VSDPVRPSEPRNQETLLSHGRRIPRRKEGSKDSTPEKVVQDIRRKTRRRFSAKEKIRIVLEGLRAKRAAPRCAEKRVWRRISIAAG